MAPAMASLASGEEQGVLKSANLLLRRHRSLSEPLIKTGQRSRRIGALARDLQLPTAQPFSIGRLGHAHGREKPEIDVHWLKGFALGIGRLDMATGDVVDERPMR